MSNFNIPRDRVTPARMEPTTDSQLAKVEGLVRLVMVQLREAQSIKDHRAHHEAFDLAEKMLKSVQMARRL